MKSPPAGSTEDAPWHIIPADRKWVARLAVAKIVVEHLEALNLRYPKSDSKDAARLADAKKYIEGELGQAKGGRDAQN